VIWDRLCSRNIILLYHRIARLELDPWEMSVTPEHFAEHLEVLRKFSRQRLDRFEPRAGFHGLSVSITFDDGYADNLHQAARLLDQFDTPATFFIATGYVGDAGEFWWDELERIVFFSPGILRPRDKVYRDLYTALQPLPHSTRRRRLDTLAKLFGPGTPARPSHRILTEKELRQLDAHPLFEIGAHTVTHPVLAAQPPAIQYAEVNDSKHWLEGLLGHSVTSFSYPYGGRGHYADSAVQAVQEAGFQRACTTEGFPVRESTSRYEWGRLNVTDTDGYQFEKFLWA
jgi:peptidoglycan/xylan/chitin deacetylase (PgdA/CDA1 family)